MLNLINLRLILTTWLVYWKSSGRPWWPTWASWVTRAPRPSLKIRPQTTGHLRLFATFSNLFQTFKCGNKFDLFILVLSSLPSADGKSENNRESKQSGSARSGRFFRHVFVPPDFSVMPFCKKERNHFFFYFFSHFSAAQFPLNCLS